MDIGDKEIMESFIGEKIIDVDCREGISDELEIKFESGRSVVIRGSGDMFGSEVYVSEVKNE